MSPIQRVESLLAGRKPDRPPYSFWCHFAPHQAYGPAAAQAHLQQLDEFEMDFLKVMNDNPYPHPRPVRTIDDLAAIGELNGDELEFARQYELLGELRTRIRGRVYMTTTIFNAWTVLRHLVQPPREQHPPDLAEHADPPSEWIRAAFRSNPAKVQGALGTIAGNLARFAARCLDAGADGIFLSVREDWVDESGRDQHRRSPSLYSRLVRPLDLAILKPTSGARFNILHVCGQSIDFRSFNDYPVHAINWADRAAGPSIADVKDWLRPAICAGVDNLHTLPDGTADDVSNEVADTILQAGVRPIMIAPGCTFDPARVPKENLRAIARAVRGLQRPDE